MKDRERYEKLKKLDAILKLCFNTLNLFILGFLMSLFVSIAVEDAAFSSLPTRIAGSLMVLGIFATAFLIFFFMKFAESISEKED